MRPADRVVPVLYSVLMHGSLIALLGWGWWQWHERTPPAPRTLAIEATVVTDQPASVTAPAPSVDDAAVQRAREQQEKEQEQELARQHAEQLQRAAEERAVAEKVAAEQAAADQAEAEKAAAEKRAAAALAELKQAAEHKRLADQQRAEAADKQRREAALRASIAAEERVTAARSGAEQAQYAALIRARIEHAWIRPPGARNGLNCEVHVTQVPGGEVTAVSIGSCNGDAAVKQSIEAAVYSASPLPTPTNSDLFERNLVFNFKPND